MTGPGNFSWLPVARRHPQPSQAPDDLTPVFHVGLASNLTDIFNRGVMRRNRFSQRFSVANTISQFCYRRDMNRLMYGISAPWANVASGGNRDVSPEKTIRLPGIKTVSKRFTVRERGMRHFQRAYCNQFIFIDDALTNIGRLNQLRGSGFPLLPCVA